MAQESTEDANVVADYLDNKLGFVVNVEATLLPLRLNTKGVLSFIGIDQDFQSTRRIFIRVMKTVRPQELLCPCLR